MKTCKIDLNEPRIVFSGKYKIIHYDKLGLDTALVEKRYNAKYIGEFSLKSQDSWVNTPVAVFYQKEIPPQYEGIGSHYFGVYVNGDGHVMITNAKSAADHQWVGVLCEETNTILYSAYRHDFQVYKDLMADGGPDYTRSSTHNLVKINIKDGDLEITHDNFT